MNWRKRSHDGKKRIKLKSSRNFTELMWHLCIVIYQGRQWIIEREMGHLNLEQRNEAAKFHKIKTLKNPQWLKPELKFQKQLYIFFDFDKSRQNKSM